jgi:hypothetical protein
MPRYRLMPAPSASISLSSAICPVAKLVSWRQSGQAIFSRLTTGRWNPHNLAQVNRHGPAGLPGIQRSPGAGKSIAAQRPGHGDGRLTGHQPGNARPSGQGRLEPDDRSRGVSDDQRRATEVSGDRKHVRYLAVHSLRRPGLVP